MLTPLYQLHEPKFPHEASDAQSRSMILCILKIIGATLLSQHCRLAVVVSFEEALLLSTKLAAPSTACDPRNGATWLADTPVDASVEICDTVDVTQSIESFGGSPHVR